MLEAKTLLMPFYRIRGFGIQASDYCLVHYPYFLIENNSERSEGH